MEFDLRGELHRLGDDPALHAARLPAETLTTRLRRRRTARRAGIVGAGALTAVALVAAGAFGMQQLPGVHEQPVANTPTESTEPEPAPTSSPAPTDPPTDPPATDESSTPVFRSGARIDDLPADAPEADVVAHLTATLGTEPDVVLADEACPSNGAPGRILEWPASGVMLRVRTTDDAGNAVAPYAAAWILTEESAARGLATEAGLTVGATRSQVSEMYPGARSSDEERVPAEMGWWYEVTDPGGELFISGDPTTGTVHRIESGFGCGD